MQNIEEQRSGRFGTFLASNRLKKCSPTFNIKGNAGFVC
jgi:hypothetical protein